MATGVPKPAAPSKKDPKQKGDQDELEAAILRHAHEALLQDFEKAGVAGELVKEDDVENNPADGEEAVAGAEDGGLGGQASGHAEDPDGATERCGEAKATRRSEP